MRKWKTCLTGAAAVGMAACMAAYPALAAAPAENPEMESPGTEREEDSGFFQVWETPLAVQSYDSGGYQIDVYGAFTQMTDPNGAVTALEGSRLLYKRGTMLSVSSDFDFYGNRLDQVVVDSVSGSQGTTQYLSVLESDRSLEDYYTEIQWPEELSNSNIVEISSTLDTSEPVLMVRYSDNTVAAFNYVTGSLLFKDESEKSEIGFGEYLEGWFTGTWDNLFGTGNSDYSGVEQLWGEAQTGVFNGFFSSQGSASQGGSYVGGELFLTGNGTNLVNGGQAGSEPGGSGGENGLGEDSPKKELTIENGMLVVTGGDQLSMAETVEDAGPQGSPLAGGLESGPLMGSPESGTPESDGKTAEGSGSAASGEPDQSESDISERAGWEPEADSSLPGEGAGQNEVPDGLDAPGMAGDPETAGEPQGEGETAEDDTADAVPASGLTGTEEVRGIESAAESPASSLDGTETAGTLEETAEQSAAAGDGASLTDGTGEGGIQTEDISTTSGQIEGTSETGGQPEETEPGGSQTDETGEAGSQTSETGEPEDQAADGDSKTGTSVSAEGLVTVYNPVTKTYEVYVASEYLSSGSAKPMSLSEKKAAMAAASVETMDSGPQRISEETRGGMAVVAVTAVCIGLLLLLLHLSNRKMKD